VDDDSAVRTLLFDVLREAGFSVSAIRLAEESDIKAPSRQLPHPQLPHPHPRETACPAHEPRRDPDRCAFSAGSFARRRLLGGPRGLSRRRRLDCDLRRLAVRRQRARHPATRSKRTTRLWRASGDPGKRCTARRAAAPGEAASSGSVLTAGSHCSARPRGAIRKTGWGPCGPRPVIASMRWLSTVDTPTRTERLLRRDSPIGQPGSRSR